MTELGGEAHEVPKLAAKVIGVLAEQAIADGVRHRGRYACTR
jgi:hypothetical protein